MHSYMCHFNLTNTHASNITFKLNYIEGWVNLKHFK